MYDKELNNFIEKFRDSKKLQEKIVDALSEKTKIHNVTFLIDTYGIYLGAKKFWSEFSSRRTHWAINFIATRALEMLRTGYEVYSVLHYKNLIREHQLGAMCLDLENDLVRVQQELGKYDGILKCRFSNFYAAAPDDNNKIENLIIAKFSDRELAESKIQDLRRYPDFINYLRSSQFTKGKIQKGYLQLSAENGKAKLNEKEVDAILIIEAMDILYGGEMQEVVLVSNDSDFNALGTRFWGTETKFSQVSLGNIISGGGFSRLKYKPDQEILDFVNRKKILTDLINESEVYRYTSSIHSERSQLINKGEIGKINDFLDHQVLE